jgi:hypothetical protein
LSTVTLQGCSSTTLVPSSGQPQATRGAVITFTARATGCPSPVYEFWLEDTNSVQHKERGFASGNAWTWNTAGWAPGAYLIQVWANNLGADTSTYEALGSLIFTLN